jgi:hypothetical protein
MPEPTVRLNPTSSLALARGVGLAAGCRSRCGHGLRGLVGPSALHTRSAERFGASISEETMRLDPRQEWGGGGHFILPSLGNPSSSASVTKPCGAAACAQGSVALSAQGQRHRISFKLDTV